MKKGAQVAGTPVELVDSGQSISLWHSLLPDFSNPWTGVGTNHSTGGEGSVPVSGIRVYLGEGVSGSDRSQGGTGEALHLQLE